MDPTILPAARNASLGMLSSFLPSIENLDFRRQELLDQARLAFLYSRPMDLKDWIRAVRTSLHLSQEQFGHRFSVTKGNVSAWENGRHSPSFDQLMSMSEMSGMALPSGTSVTKKPVTFVTGDVSAADFPARSPEPKYAPTEITYDVIKGAVSGVLQAFGLRFEDLVQDAAARRRIEAALKPREHQEPARADDEEILSHGSYGPFAPEMPEARPVLGIRESHYPAEVDPYADLNAQDEQRPKQKERRG